jgi:HK97 family phage prohead protease
MSKQNKPVTPKHELRVVKNVQRLEIRKNAAGQRTVSGYFATFNTLSSDLGGFVERISPGAYTQSLRDNPEVLCLYNHNTDLILGRVSSGTLSVSEDSIGLRFKVTLPDTSYANDLVNLMERGDVAACSFAFSINGDNGDTWEMIGDKLVRTLVSVNLYEGSIVGNPAYPNTVADLRSCPVTLRSKLSKRDGSESDSPDDHPGQHWSDEDDDWVDDSMSEADDDTDEEWNSRSASFRCQYRCLHCRSIHSNLTEDDPSARSANSNLTEDYFAVRCAKRCAERCQQCRSMSSHYPTANAVNEDDPTARAYKHLLSLRR